MSAHPSPKDVLERAGLEALRPGPEHELDAAGYALVRAGRAQPETLYSAWIDAEHGRLSSGWIARVALRTVELAEGARGRFTRPMADALDRCFGALAAGAVPASVADPCGALLTGAARSVAAAVADALEPSPAWTELATSVVAIWPEALRAAFAPLTEPTAYPAAFIGYLTTLAYATLDRPFGGSSPLLWWRFAEERGVRWSDDACAVLAELTEPQRVRPLVEPALAALPETQRRAWEPHLPALFEIQLGADYPRRRAIVLRKLAEAEPSPHWDDELGIG